MGFEIAKAVGKQFLGFDGSGLFADGTHDHRDQSHAVTLSRRYQAIACRVRPSCRASKQGIVPLAGIGILGLVLAGWVNRRAKNRVVRAVTYYPAKTIGFLALAAAAVGFFANLFEFIPERMFPGEVVVAVFFGTIPLILLAAWLGGRNFHVENALWIISLVAGLYCVLAGLSLVPDWEVPFANIDAEGARTLGRTAAHGRGRGAFIIPLIMFWPYALIGWGGCCVYLAGSILRSGPVERIALAEYLRK